MIVVAPTAQLALPDEVCIVAGSETWDVDNPAVSAVVALGISVIPRSLAVAGTVLLPRHGTVERSGFGGADSALTAYRRRAPPISMLVQ